MVFRSTRLLRSLPASAASWFATTIPSTSGVYWTTEAIYPLLGIAVMYEVFRNVFRNFSRLWWFPPLFPFTVLLSLGLTISRSLSVPSGLQGGVLAWIVGAELGVRLLQVAMFALLVTMVLLFGLRWRQQAFGICAGYGLFATRSPVDHHEILRIRNKIQIFVGIGLHHHLQYCSLDLALVFQRST